MFYENIIKSKKTKEREFFYDMLSNSQKSEEDDSVLEFKQPKIVYNFVTENGALKTGYGFSALKMPESKSDLDYETEIEVSGNEVKGLWKLNWFDNNSTFTDKYYVFYFNDNNKICYNNIFEHRYVPMVINTSYTELPSCLYLRQGNEDSLLFSGNGNGLMLVSGSGIDTNANGPKFISCCTHYGKLFAITASKRENLLYTDETSVLSWSSEQTQNLDFSDGRGNLNKILSFDDNLYIFRDFGITKVSIYGNDENFAVSHMYFSDSYIYPNSIAQSGDKIYFLTKSGLKVFNGNTVKDLNLDGLKLANKCDNTCCSGVCFNGKYYLACRADFGDNTSIGCEDYANGYTNNMLYVYDILSGHEDIVRGVDVKQLLALSNPLKSKLIACFNGQYKNKIAQLSLDGKVFGDNLASVITFAKTNFGDSNEKKRVKAFLIKSSGDCTVSISNEQKTYSYFVKGGANIQKIRTNVAGKNFSVEISAGAGEKNISSFVLIVGEKQ